MQKIFRKFKIEIEGNINNEIDQNYDNEPTIKNDDYEQEKFEKVESKTDIPQKAEKKNNIEFKSNVEAKPSIPVKKFRPNLNLNKNF